MRILWHNIIASILFVIALILLFKCWPDIMGTLTSIKHIGPGYPGDEKVIGLLALGLVCAFLVAIVRILTSQRK